MTELLNKRVDEISGEYIFDIKDDFSEYLGFIQNDESESMWEYIDFEGEFVDYFETINDFLLAMGLKEYNLKPNET